MKYRLPTQLPVTVSVALEEITPAAVLAWKNRRLRDAEADPLAKRRAAVTVNSLMRNAKALFGKKLLPFVEQSIVLPRPLPFDGVSLEKEPSLRYISKIDPFALLALAKEELANDDQEAFKVMILALVCGLRRAEIDHLLWRAFDFPNAVLRVESSEFHELKSEDSVGRIDLDADTLALFRGYRAKEPKAQFVVASPLKPTKKPKPGRYRCNPVFARVIEWLRKNGVDGHKPIHTLRKEIGSIIAMRARHFRGEQIPPPRGHPHHQRILRRKEEDRDPQDVRGTSRRAGRNFHQVQDRMSAPLPIDIDEFRIGECDRSAVASYLRLTSEKAAAIPHLAAGLAPRGGKFDPGALVAKASKLLLSAEAQVAAERQELADRMNQTTLLKVHRELHGAGDSDFQALEDPPRLSAREERVKEAVLAGRVHYRLLKIARPHRPERATST